MHVIIKEQFTYLGHNCNIISEWEEGQKIVCILRLFLYENSKEKNVTKLAEISWWPEW